MFLGKGIDVLPNKYCLVGEWALGGSLTHVHARDVVGHGADETRQILPSLSSARVEQSGYSSPTNFFTAFLTNSGKGV